MPWVFIVDINLYHCLCSATISVIELLSSSVYFSEGALISLLLVLSISYLIFEAHASALSQFPILYSWTPSVYFFFEFLQVLQSLHAFCICSDLPIHSGTNKGRSCIRKYTR
eukprot:c1948_g1_i1 orf=423-758(+)